MSTKKENNKSIAGRFAEERKRLGKTQQELGSLCDTSREMIGRYEKGTSVPGGEVLSSFAIQGADVQYVLSGKRLPAQTHKTDKAPPHNEGNAKSQKISMQEDLLATKDRVIAMQDQEISRLKAEVEKLKNAPLGVATNQKKAA